MNQYKIFFKTSENMAEIEDEHVKTVITSPPYWDLKNYLTKNQIGYNETYEQYLKRLSNVWKECFRILKSNGSVWININSRTYKKQFYLIPFDIIKEMLKIGFYYKGTFIWHKPSGIPASPKNLSDHFEYILAFVKNKDNFRFNNKNLWKDDYNLLENDKIGTTWRIIKKAGSVGKYVSHPAIYPDELVERIVKLTSDEGDIIVDPFLGSGTTLIASGKLNRSCIAYELNNEEYKKIIEKRIKSLSFEKEVLFL